MDRSTPRPSHPRIRRLMSWLAAVVLASALSTFAAAAPASAAPSDVVYHPPCYDLCLGYNAPPFMLTASSRYNVGPTPYYISIFDVRTGERLGVCGTGTECTTSPFGKLSIGYPCFTYVAYIGGSGDSMPPAPVQLTSPIFTHCFGAG